jgi:multidrug resistance efflux pump
LSASPGAPRLVLTGELRAVNADDIRTPITSSWPIQIRWMAPEGTLAAAGDTILEFDNTGILSKLEDQRLALSDAENRLRSREAQIDGERAEKSFNVERARIELEKARIESAVPAEMRARRDYDLKQLALEKARSALAGAERTLAAFEISAKDDLEVLRIETDKSRRSVERATESLEQLTVKASRAGVLLYADHPWEGRKFQAGDDTFPRMTVMRIPDLGRMEVVGWLSDLDDGAVKPGQRVTCVLDTYPDRTFPGRIRDVSALAEPRSRESTLRAFQVSIDLDRTDPFLMRPGMSVRIELARDPA